MDTVASKSPSRAYLDRVEAKAVLPRLGHLPKSTLSRSPPKNLVYGDLPYSLMPKMTSQHRCLYMRLCCYEALYSRFILSILLTLLLLSTSSSGVVLPELDGSLSLYNTSASSKALKEYVIYSFVEGASAKAQNEEIRSHLGMMLAPVNVQEYGGDYTGVEFWHVKMNDVQRAAFSGVNPRVNHLQW